MIFLSYDNRSASDVLPGNSSADKDATLICCFSQDGEWMWSNLDLGGDGTLC